MNLSSLTSADLKHIGSLLTRKEQLLGEISKIENELGGYESGPKRPVRSNRASGPGGSGGSAGGGATASGGTGRITGGRAKRGQLKEMILTILKEAGRDGVSIQDIANKAGVKATNVSAWLAVTGKSLGLIEKADRGVYRLKG